MSNIVTITLNPALDVSADAPAVVAGPKLRLGTPVFEPGGGGINVARTIRILGGQARVLAALGGLTGARLKALLLEGGLDLIPFPVPGETRQSLSVTDLRDGEQYRFVLPGPIWDPALETAILNAAEEHVPRGGWVVLSGSQPPGVGAEFPARLAQRLQPAAAQLVVDTSGPALDFLVSVGSPAQAPFCLRMDQAESEEKAGHPLTSVSDSLAFAEALVARGAAKIVVLARGADGSVLVGDGLRLHCRPPGVTVKSKVGAGDSFTGAFVLALARGDAPGDALRLATAAAAAAVMTGSTELCRREDTERLARDCTLQMH